MAAVSVISKHRMRGLMPCSSIWWRRKSSSFSSPRVVPERLMAQHEMGITCHAFCMAARVSSDLLTTQRSTNGISP
ncbi:hypothetical protein D3C72_1406080 [compost metagenome]